VALGFHRTLEVALASESRSRWRGPESLAKGVERLYGRMLRLGDLRKLVITSEAQSGG